MRNEAVPEAFIARFDGFEGSLSELNVALRSGRIVPLSVPLLELTTLVLARFSALVEKDLDQASETLPLLAGVIELKARLLLPSKPKVTIDPLESPEDELELVLESVATLVGLENATQFLRERRVSRARMVPAPPRLTPPKRVVPPVGRGLHELVEAARRRVRDIKPMELSIERLALPHALRRLRLLLERVKQFLFHEVEAANWGERSVLFSALLEGIREGEWTAQQEEQFGPINVHATKAHNLKATNTPHR